MYTHMQTCSHTCTGVRQPWRELGRAGRGSPVWQREYRVLASLLHSLTFLMPLMACAERQKRQTETETNIRSVKHATRFEQDSGSIDAAGDRSSTAAVYAAATTSPLAWLHAAVEAAEKAQGQGDENKRSGHQDRRGNEDLVHRNLVPVSQRQGCQVWEHLVPSVTGIQVLLEKAWAEGFDPPGAAYFDGGKVIGRTKPIGATECAVLLRYLGFRALLMDFERPCPEQMVHVSLLELCRWWFLSGCSCRFPLYLQYGSGEDEPGGSLLVVGIYASAAFASADKRQGLDSISQEGGQREAQCQCCWLVAGPQEMEDKASREREPEGHAGAWVNGTHEEWDTLVRDRGRG